MEIVQLLSAAGIGGIVGSLITTVVKEWLAGRVTYATRSFQERKEAYAGILEAMHRAEIEGTAEAAMRAGYWKNRCELVAPASVRTVLDKVFATNPIAGKPHPDRPDAVAELKAAMRTDLGIAPN